MTSRTKTPVPIHVTASEIASNITSTPSSRSLISDLEAKHYYHGLHSKAVLIARTGMTEWKPPTGPEPYFVPKTIRTAGKHQLQGLWEEELGPQIHQVMEENGVRWTSTDVDRIGNASEEAAPLVIWIGVMPKTLSREHGQAIAFECKMLLLKRKIDDVEVEIRESMVTRYTGPPLEKPAPTYNPIAELLEPLTSTLGLPICNEKTPDSNGTGGFYVMDSESKTYLITARHVLFGEEDDNKIYNGGLASQPCINVLLFSPASFNTYLKKIEESIIDQRVFIDYAERGLKAPADKADRDWWEITLSKGNKTMDALQKHYDYVAKHWSKTTDRIIGSLRFSPPIVLDEKNFTQDYALMEMAPDKIDPDSFTGNAIDLGTEICPGRFTSLMYPSPHNSHGFKYPVGRIFKIQGIIPPEELSKSTMLDPNEIPSLIVMKRGLATGLTLGRVNEINSFTRTYFTDTTPKKALEWVICPYDSKSPPFAAHGDSGSAIVDSQGRLGGIVTSGHDNLDLTYATPAFSILHSLQTHGFKVTI